MLVSTRALLSRSLNLTSATNAFTRVSHTSGRPLPAGNGIPRLDRADVRRIAVLKNSTDLVIAGRSKANGFMNNQFMLASKAAGDAVMVNAADDFMEDWVLFAEAFGVRISRCFVQHCHIDDICNLPHLWDLVPGLQCLWCPADLPWIERFPQACERYQRLDVRDATLPLRPEFGHQLLDCATNRSSSFVTIGNTAAFYVHTPGHSPGHMMLHLPVQRMLFTGDLLFRDGVGRVDIPFGAADVLAQSLRTLEELPDNTVILPSHGKITTLGRERRENPALIRLYDLLAAGKHSPHVGANEGFL